jgi:hypothetical protein
VMGDCACWLGLSVIWEDSEMNKIQISARCIGVISRSDSQGPRSESILEWQCMRVQFGAAKMRRTVR